MHTLTDNLALDAGDAFQRNLDAEVAACNHDSIAGLDDLIDVVDTFLVLNLRNDLDVTVVLVENVLNGLHVSC